MENKMTISRLLRRGSTGGESFPADGAGTARDRLRSLRELDQSQPVSGASFLRPRQVGEDEAPRPTPSQRSVAQPVQVTRVAQPVAMQPPAHAEPKKIAPVPAAAPQAIQQPSPSTPREAQMSNPSTPEKRNQSAFDASKPVTMSVLSPSMNLSGIELDTDEDLTVQGIVSGKLRVRELIIARGATVEGEIIAELIKVHGTVNARVTAASFMVANGASVSGEITGGSIGIQPGARIKAALNFDKTEALGVGGDSHGSDMSGSHDASLDGGFQNIVHFGQRS